MNLPEVLSVVGLFTGVQFPRNVNRCLKFCCDRRVRRMRIRLYSQDLLSDKYVVTVLCLLAWSCCCFCWNPGKGKHVQIDCLGHRCVLCVFSERELMFMFAICRRPSVCRLSVCRLSVTFVHPSQVKSSQCYWRTQALLSLYVRIVDKTLILILIIFSIELRSISGTG